MTLHFYVKYNFKKWVVKYLALLLYLDCFLYASNL